MPSQPLPLVLASSSPTRRELLAKLQLSFICASPDVDETPRLSEDVQQLVQRLSQEKAQALATDYPRHLIIGSDQALSLDGEILGKPLSHDRAHAQLSRLSGRRVVFYTGLCLLNSETSLHETLVETYTVQLRPLTPEAIERYLRADQPYQCAGSFKAESLGISLFESFSGRDPNTLLGLPLMALCDLLKNAGYELP